MKIDKESFYLGIIFIVLSAGALAYFLQPLTDDFIAPMVVSLLKLKLPPSAYASYFSPDIAFFCLFAIISLAVLRTVQRVEPLIYIIYGASLFFCFFYFFIAPFESVIVLLAFFAPVFMWHQKRINNLLLVIIAFVLIAVSWYFLNKPAIFLLMMPMCHLFAIRANNSLQSRYSGREVRVLSRLSSTQKSKVTTDHSVLLKQDLWEIISPELEALAESWGKVRDLKMNDSDSSDDEPVRLFRPVGVLSSMLEVQDEKTIAAAIEALKNRDANFSADLFLSKFRQIFKRIHMACYDHKIENIQPMLSDALYEQFRCRVEEQKDAGVQFKCSHLDIVGLRIARVSSDSNFDEIHLLVRAEAVETAIDIVSGETLNAEDKNQKITEFWSFIRRPSAKTISKPGLMEGSCPNCGALISIGQATVCSVCHSFLRSGYYDWVLSKITQACEWEYANPRLVPGWNDIAAADANFSIHQIEDRSAVIFWVLRLVERKRIMEPLLRFATAKCCENFRFAMKGLKNYTYMENVSFASATLRAISITRQCERIYVLIVWSGIPVTCTPEGRLPQIHRISKPKRDVFVFVRKAGQKTSQNNTLTSAHCPQCGGPLTSNYAVNCKYCNTVLNDGSEWILEKVISEKSQEYIDLVSQKQQLMKQVVEEVNKEREDTRNIRSGRDLVSMSAQMLLADGKIDDAEMAMLKKFAARFEMPDDAVEGIIAAIKEDDFYIPQPEDHKEAASLLEAAVCMAIADGEIAPEEQKYLDSLLEKFGYAKADLMMLVKKAERLLREDKRQEEIRQRKLKQPSQ